MNQLSEETSPYLLQHKHNPVNWFAWNNDAWQKAQSENKLVLISIGYSACHWCHVMEREVFEDNECAEFMNKHFVCIKVDREERPDVDGIYMEALHLMGRQGGWPLNVFTLPDGRPIYGGTYFPKMQWINVLDNLQDLFKNDYDKVTEYASRVQEGLNQLDLIESNDETAEFDARFLNEVVKHWSQSWDWEKGGNDRAPKFPMPNNWEFLLHYGVKTSDKNSVEMVHHSLAKMALGGIYDQVGGGFARYSVDDVWKVPHFEKMLYDNAQLISLYAQAYRESKSVLYKVVIEQTITWAEREMKSESGLFYAALDADSEGVEGKFYTWSEEELVQILSNDFDLCKKYYAVGKEGFWEHDQNILLRTKTDEDFAKDENIDIQTLKERIGQINKTLLDKRKDRIRPGLDNKCLTSWNALMVTAYVEAYRALQNEEYLESAVALSKAILKELRNDDGTLLHVHTNGQSRIAAFLDSYAFLAEAFIALYETSGEEVWLKEANNMAQKAIVLFYDSSSGMFYYTAMNSEKLIARKKEVQDNVIPSSNSAMCKALFRLSRHFENEKYETMSRQLLSNILPQINYASGYSNWLQCYLWQALPFYEVVVIGTEAMAIRQDFFRHFLPNAIFAASTTESELPLFVNRFGTNSAIYVCTGKMCFAPLTKMEEVIPLLK